MARRLSLPAPRIRLLTPALLATTLLVPGLVVASLVAPTALTAQGVAGRVVEAGTDTPVAGAFLALERDTGDRVAAGLTGTDGRFTLRAPGPGSYRVRVQRIGYRGTLTDVVTIARDEVRILVIDVPGEAVELEGLRVEGEGRCVLRPEEGEATHRLWTEARKALEVAEWTERDRALTYELLLFERKLDAVTGVVTEEAVHHFELTHDRPFISDPPDSLARLGYARRRGRAIEYYGPDAAALLSDVFLDTHCFRRVPGGSALLGLAFSPVADTVADIRGTLWIDRSTAELRLLEFRYVRPPIPTWVDPEEYGGTVRFRRLPDGAWIISHWKIRSPSFQRGRRRVALSGFTETEGDLVALADTAGRPIPHQRIAAQLIGHVRLPDGRGPAAGAEVRLVGTPYEIRADEHGNFGLAGLPEGRYRLHVEHPDLPRRGVERVVELGRGATTRVRIEG